ncbi:MAG: peptidoglycan DD-metalloendopeptidase family protein [Eubacteriales bacterium]|nr:peptidoglycan DD-metalloendopeptidase family protein [Christensenellaceae bacterium]MEA5066209.1 peptidoglycan DD-metalloendopeptidase family protein [Eubacteriales bacterium]
MAKRTLALLVTLLLCACSRVLAGEAMQSTLATEYGAWSAWREDMIAPAEGAEVEAAERAADEDKPAWRYTRYEYFNELEGKAYAAPTEQAGAHVRAGSGHWAEREEAAPLKAVGEQDGRPLYEGGWYNEQQVAKPSERKATMYRSRAVRRITCEVSAKELLLFEGDSRRLAVNLFDGSEQSFASDNPSVATVDAAGNVNGISVGAARIRVRSKKGRVVDVWALVCEKGAMPPEGLYTLRLHGTDRALTVGRRLTKKSDNLVAAPYAGERAQKFLLGAVGKKTFMLHPLKDRKWYVDIRRGKQGLQVGGNVQTHQKRDRTSQYWRAIYVPDGSYIIYPRAAPELTLGAEPLEAGNNVRVEAMLDELERLDRWVLVKVDKDADAFDRPLPSDGMSFIAREHGDAAGQEGIWFETNGRRAFVLAAARGTVLEAVDTCPHDDPKRPAAQGGFADPCTTDRASLGNYVVIDHGGGITALYAHLSEVYVEAGATVRKGSMIGRSGATGSTGSVGLLFEMRENDQPIDPRIRIELPKLNEPIE